MALALVCVFDESKMIGAFPKVCIILLHIIVFPTNSGCPIFIAKESRSFWVLILEGKFMYSLSMLSYLGLAQL